MLELHGTIHSVDCMNCTQQEERSDLQKRLYQSNEQWKQNILLNSEIMMRPDGDMELSDEEIRTFIQPKCINCDGPLKPSVVFHGGILPKSVTTKSLELVRECDSVLILGSTLSVMSSFRLALRAHEYRHPIGIVNIGETRGDKLASVKVEANCSLVLSSIELNL